MSRKNTPDYSHHTLIPHLRWLAYLPVLAVTILVFIIGYWWQTKRLLLLLITSAGLFIVTTLIFFTTPSPPSLPGLIVNQASPVRLPTQLNLESVKTAALSSSQQTQLLVESQEFLAIQPQVFSLLINSALLYSQRGETTLSSRFLQLAQELNPNAEIFGLESI